MRSDTPFFLLARGDRLAPRDRQGEMDFLMAADFFFQGALHVIPDSEGVRDSASISRIRYCSFRAPLQRGFWAAWAGEPQVLSHVAATTC